MAFSENEFKFFIDLYARGNNEFDHEKQFFYYYVLFNFLYNFYDDETNPRSSETERRNKNEERRIKAFVGHVIQSYAACFSNYNPFAQLNTCKYTELITKVEEKIGKVNLEYSYKSNEKEIKALFIEIYNVRCDIFHGSKNFTHDEPRRLIFACNEVFKRFFDFYFQAFAINYSKVSDLEEKK
jgi:hypothetical protein